VTYFFAGIIIIVAARKWCLLLSVLASAATAMGKVASVAPPPAARQKAPPFSIQDVLGGGDCLFQSLAVAESWADRGVNLGFAGAAPRASELRKIANDFLCPGGKPSQATLHGLPIEFVMEPRRGEGGCGYCRRMRRQGEWGSAAEILALTRALRRPVTVYVRLPGGVAGAHKRAPRFAVMDTYGREVQSEERELAGSSRGPQGTPLSILYVSDVHYMALLPSAPEAAATEATTPACRSKPSQVCVKDEGTCIAVDADEDLLRDFLAGRPELKKVKSKL
jgi:hypothetical protein